VSGLTAHVLFLDQDKSIDPVLAVVQGKEVICAVPMSNEALFEMAGKMLVAAASRMGFAPPEVRAPDSQITGSAPGNSTVH
jgi:hypothetical protein